jgi:hypothetical protein
MTKLTTEDVRQQYVGENYFSAAPHQRDYKADEQDGAEFDEWLANERADALEQASDGIILQAIAEHAEHVSARAVARHLKDLAAETRAAAKAKQ